MKIFTGLLIISIAFCCISSTLTAQNDEEWVVSVEELEQFKVQTHSLVKYLEGTLNFLGDARSSVQEKEIIIYESYDKIFVSDKVQIEDDLDENRDVPVNKDVQAYLKDVDFFFSAVNFHFDIQNIEPLVSENGSMYFRVTLMRQLIGLTVNGDSINASRLRYLEINLDPFKKDLKIASYYTTKINEQEELRHWWAIMPEEWKLFFGEKTMVLDSIAMSDIKEITNEAIIVDRWISVPRRGAFFVIGSDTLPEAQIAILYGRKPDTTIVLNDFIKKQEADTLTVNIAAVDNRLKQFTLVKEIDISYKPQFTSLEPLSQLSDLELIDFSNTPVSDLSPLRNLNKLKAIYMSGTLVTNLSPLQYAANIQEIYCFDTELDDISIMAHFRQLEKLFCFNTKIKTLKPLERLTNLTVLRAGNTLVENATPLREMANLRILDLSHTRVSDLSPLKDLVSLNQLNIDHTLVDDLSPLSKLTALTTIQFSNTNVSDLSPLQSIPELKKVYSDKNGVSAAMAIAFMRSKPGVLVIYDSEELNAWWDDLPIYWRAILTEQSGISGNPTTEDLHLVINMEKLNLDGNTYLQDMQPVNRLVNLQELSLSHTEITDLSPLIGLSDLKILDLSNTRVSNIEPLERLFQLERLNIEDTRIDSLSSLHQINSLKLLLADKSRVRTEAVRNLKKNQTQLIVVYQTETLRFWWNNLNEDWKEVFSHRMQLNLNPTPLQLQAMADKKTIEVKDILTITNLEPLVPLLQLEKLVITGTTVSDLSPLIKLNQLLHLELSGNPIVDLSPLQNLTQLEYLNIESTPVADLSPLSKLVALKTLNVGGTQIRTLKPLANLNQLEELSIFNTRIKSLVPVNKLTALKHLKCYNTRISRKNIEKAKSENPSLNILYY